VKLHSRVMLCQKHHADFFSLMCDFMKDRDITYTELLVVINQVTAEAVLKYMLREERHPDDPEKRAGEE
jgi:hypothetical protein